MGNTHRDKGVQSIVQLLVIGLVGVLLLGACDGDDEPGRADRTPRAADVTASPRDKRPNETSVRIDRDLPDGPLFVEGSAAYALLRDVRTDEIVLSGFFDVPRYRDTDERWPRRLKGRVRPGRYDLVTYQRPCDASACMQSQPEDWDPPVMRCSRRIRLAPAHVVMITAVVDEGGCRFETTAYLRGETG